MPGLLRYPVEKFLLLLVRAKIKRTRPRIIGITGSFGKTTTKEAVSAVLRLRYKVLSGEKSLNTEIGLLLAALGQPSGFRSPLKWLRILVSATVDAFFAQPCDFWVLEYGADKPGDIRRLVALVKPETTILTSVSRVHQAPGQFRDTEAVFKEKKILVECLTEDGAAIINRDDPYLQKLSEGLKAKTYWFRSEGGDGSRATPEKHERNNMQADELKDSLDGFSATISDGKRKGVRANFPIAGSFHINAFLPALCVGKLNGIPIEEGIEALQKMRLPPGRMSCIEGKNGSMLLDSTYNASPETVRQALRLLQKLSAKRKIAVLGNMNELGDATEQAHRELAVNIGPWLDHLITVGEYAAVIADECLKNGFPKARIKILPEAGSAGEFLLYELPVEKGDLILFKGSQNRVRLERAVKMLMARPEEAKKLLCRQEEEWEAIR